MFSKSTFNLQTHNILKFCWKQRDLCRQWRCQLILFLLFNIVQIQIILTSNLISVGLTISTSWRVWPKYSKKSSCFLFCSLAYYEMDDYSNFPLPPCNYLEDTVTERSDSRKLDSVSHRHTFGAKKGNGTSHMFTEEKNIWRSYSKGFVIQKKVVFTIKKKHVATYIFIFFPSTYIW